MAKPPRSESCPGTDLKVPVFRKGTGKPGANKYDVGRCPECNKEVKIRASDGLLGTHYVSGDFNKFQTLTFSIDFVNWAQQHANQANMSLETWIAVAAKKAVHEVHKKHNS